MASIGVDFGSAYARMGSLRSGVPTLLPFHDGSPWVPSVVCVDDGEILVGTAALACATTHPTCTVRGVKRILGRTFSEPWVDRLRARLPFATEPGRDDKLLVRLGRCAVEPEAVAELILRRVITCAEGTCRTFPLSAVIGVPTWFEASACDALERAAHRAGFLRVELMHEAVAAALAHPTCQSGLTAVVDLGASACSASVLRVGPEEVVLLSSATDRGAGGEEVDHVLLQWVRESLEERHGPARDDACVLESMRQACEWARRDMLHHDTTVASVSYASVAWGIRPQRVGFQRAGVEALMRPIAKRVESVCEQALSDADIDAASLSAIYVVGGMADTAVFRAAIERSLGSITLSSVPASDAVALGATIRAAVIDGLVQGVPLVDARGAQPPTSDVVPVLEPVANQQTEAPEFAPSEEQEDDFEHDDTTSALFTAELLHGSQRHPKGIPLEASCEEPVCSNRRSFRVQGPVRDPIVDRADAICRHMTPLKSVSERSVDVLLRTLSEIEHDGFVERAVSHMQRAASYEVRSALVGYIQRFVDGHEHHLGPVVAVAAAGDALRLMNALASRASESARRAIGFGLRSSFATVRMHALACVTQDNNSWLDWQYLQPLLTDGEQEVRLQVLELMTQRRFAAAGLALARRIRSDVFDHLSVQERKLLLDALALVSPKRAETYAIGLLESNRLFASNEHNQSRAIAADYLARSDTKEALDALERNAQRWFVNASVVRSSASRAARKVEHRRSTMPPPPKP